MTTKIKLEFNLETLIEAIKSLDFETKRKLWTALSEQMQEVEVEGTNEMISPQEIAMSDEAWNDYISGVDLGISSQQLKETLESV